MHKGLQVRLSYGTESFLIQFSVLPVLKHLFRFFFSLIALPRETLIAEVYHTPVYILWPTKTTVISRICFFSSQEPIFTTTENAPYKGITSSLGC